MIPNLCGDDPKDPSSGTTLFDNEFTPPLEIPGLDGMSFGGFEEWRGTGTVWTMPCSGITIQAGEGEPKRPQGCAERMCAQGSLLEPKAEDVELCVNSCRKDKDDAKLDTYYNLCSEVCGPDGNDADCVLCQEQCIAACSCPAYCQPYKND